MKTSFIKLLLSLTLSILTIFNPIVANATSISNLPNIPSAQHKHTIQEFITELNTLQNRIYSLTQFSLGDESTPPPSDFSATIRSINNDLAQLNREIGNYYDTLPTFSEENREVLLVFNAYNFTKDGLYTLSLLNTAPSSIERIQLLDRYFKSRLSALDTLNLLNELLSSY
ncbi:MAG: hypothetical protein AB9856_20995 [Cellulosilyticaceae bacterium]